jgi:hypothetical protein
MGAQRAGAEPAALLERERARELLASAIRAELG